MMAQEKMEDHDMTEVDVTETHVSMNTNSVEPDADVEGVTVDPWPDFSERVTCITFTEDGDDYFLSDEGEMGFDITTDCGTASMSKRAAVAIAHAILRMAGESK
jgi:hypothetical protein